MKIKTVSMPYSEVKKLPKSERFMPQKPNPILRTVMRLASAGDLKATDFSYTEERMDSAGEGPWLILMNHSSFIDLEMCTRIFAGKPYCIVCTSDGFVGKKGLMRAVGCIPTRKFVRDVTLINDISYTLNELKTSVLMYPEASYTFDGCATPLPRKLGVLIKKLDVSVVTVHTEGAFARDPLYNCLQKRDVKVSANVKCLFTRDEIKEKSVKELDEALDREFTFDSFRWQQEKSIEIKEEFRADGLERILYHCPHCHSESGMRGKGIKLRCENCGTEYTLSTLGRLESENAAFDHIPDWYNYERELVKKEISDGSYELTSEVEIGVMRDYKAIYMTGSGKLRHDVNGFELISDDGELSYKQSPLACYSLYSDYYWYEIGDVICIGNNDELYYCFPKTNVPVAKARLAAEELYKYKKDEKRAAFAGKKHE